MAAESRREAEPARVAKVLDPFQIVLNKGEKDGVGLGESFLVYGIGSEVEDPVTGRNLGPVELVRGQGKVIHLQESISILRSSEERPVYSPNPFPLATFGRPQPVRYEEQPFRGVEVGDIARRI